MVHLSREDKCFINGPEINQSLPMALLVKLKANNKHTHWRIRSQQSKYLSETVITHAKLQ